jgi:FAD/FMN-containing dehydrogenase
MKLPLIFFAVLSTVGLIMVAVARLRPEFLTVMPGALFFLGVLLATALSGVRHRLFPSTATELLAFLVSTSGYIVAVLVFHAVFSFAPEVFSVHTSNDILDFGGDVLLGLLCASITGAFGLGIIVSVTRKAWRGGMITQAVLAGFATISIAFVAHLKFHNYWSFFGVLFAVGFGMYGAILGRECEAAPLA